MSENEESQFNEIIKTEMGNFLPADSVAIHELNILAQGLAKLGRQTQYRSFCYATEVGMLSMSKEVDESGSLITVAITNPRDSEDCIAEVVFDTSRAIKSLSVDENRSQDALAVLGLSMLEEAFSDNERFAIMGLNHIFKASLESHEELEEAVNSYSSIIANEAVVAVDRLSFGQHIIYSYDYSVNEHTTLHIGMNNNVDTDTVPDSTELKELAVHYSDTLLGYEYSLYTDEEGATSITVSKIGPIDLQNDVLTYEDMSVGTVSFLKTILVDTTLKDL